MRYELIDERHAKRLLAFESENRKFFERFLPDRGDAYYDLDQIIETIRRIREETLGGRMKQYVILNDARDIIGRVNLFDIRYGIFYSGEVGYRVSERHCGKGIATAAVREMIGVASSELGLHRLEAATAPDNWGSQAVLLKNGFVRYGHSHESAWINGRWEDGIHFERLL